MEHTSQRLEVRRDDVATTRRRRLAPGPLGNGQVRVRVDRFAVTSNTVTYALVGDQIGYWRFFPTDDPWGVVPAWGFGTVTESSDSIDVGTEVFGFLPMGGTVVMQPSGVTDDRMVDASPHRADLPATYNSYARIARDADRGLDDERMLLWPLYATSFVLADWLSDNGFFGADQVILGSASSKTAIGVAYAFDADPVMPHLIGLTSERNRERVESLGLYDTVATYDEIGSIGIRPTVIVDMSGDQTVLTNLHTHLGDQMLKTSNVGLTHTDRGTRGPGYDADRSEMFFAPSHIHKRAKEWGPAAFEERAVSFWRETSLRTTEWMAIERRFGIEGIESAYDDVRTGSVPADVGIVCETRVMEDR